MEKSLQPFKPSTDDFQALKDYSNEDSVIKEIFENNDIIITDIMKCIDKMPNSQLKDLMTQAIPQVGYLYASDQAKTHLLYKTADERDIAIEAAQTWKEAFYKLSQKHKDIESVQNIEKYFSELKIKSNNSLTSYREKSMEKFILSNKEKINAIREICPDKVVLNKKHL